LVDGGVSDNLGLRGVLDSLETFEALRGAGHATELDHIRRLILFVVNSVSSPSTDWNRAENPPGTLSILSHAAGVPIDRYSSESVELLRDIDARWSAMRAIRDSIAASHQSTSGVAGLENAPNVDIFTVEVSFQALKDKAERNYLNELPTSFVLAPEEVDRLRAAAATIVFNSPDLMEALAGEHMHVLDPGTAR
jgi:NTE family protein